MFGMIMALQFGTGQALFDTRRIWQTNPVAAESNTINIALKSNTALPAGTTITIAGLTGLGPSSLAGGTHVRALSALAGYPDTSSSFACGTSSAAAGGTACFYHSAGTITFTIGAFCHLWLRMSRLPT